MLKNELIAILLIFTLSNPIFACTSAGFAGDIVKDGGTILFKNRDANINGRERLEIFKPKNKYSYIALAYDLHAKNPTYPYLAGGTNIKGLTVLVNDPASHFPLHQDVDETETKTVRNLLENYSTIKEIEKDRKQIFRKDDPALYLISDHREVANFEEGYEDKYGYKATDNGYVWNTNFYHLKKVDKQNEIMTNDVIDRTRVLKKWLSNMPDTIQLGDLTRLAASHYNGEFDSIDRKFTVAKYFAVSPSKTSNTYLYVRFTIPTQKFNSYHLKINEKFFAENPAGALNNKKYGLLGYINRHKDTDRIKTQEKGHDID